ncbi:MAG: exonuclease SbcCD subunit D [Saccharofermentans sp.]|nr:exonuclease SbcCD subunit D [Saccharofermentans sp.]
MRFFHLSDLHLGKRLNEYSLIEDQKHILLQIVDRVNEYKPDAVLIAGDVYDRTTPSDEAVQLFNMFINLINKLGVELFVSSGNHDSAIKISYAREIMDKAGVHLSDSDLSNISAVTLNDKDGEVVFYSLPYIRPAAVRQIYPDAEINSYTDAVACIINHLDINKSVRNILLSHQFVIGSSLSGSEETITVGGSDNVDVSAYEPFDYVALGHIHGAQNVGSNRIRYCGTPLKYSFSEAKQSKSISMIEINGDRDIHLTEIPLTPLRDLVEIEGTYDELMNKSFYEGTSYHNDFVRAILLDDVVIPDVSRRLSNVYHNLMRTDYKNIKIVNHVDANTEKIEELDPLDVFSKFFCKMNSKEMTDTQKEYMDSLINRILKGE